MRARNGNLLSPDKRRFKPSNTIEFKHEFDIIEQTPRET